MPAHKSVIEAFTGVSLEIPLMIRVRYGKSVKYVYVGFGEIRIPFFTNTSVNISELERKHECRIKRTGKGWIIVPNVVKEIIKRDGFLCSASEKHRKALEEWINTHGASVIKALLGLQGS